MRNSIKIVFILICLFGCVEPFTAETQEFENALVIDARLTDELKKHQVKLSRARSFEEDIPNMEPNASVTIVEDSGFTIEFVEIEGGVYESVVEFNAKENTSYELHIRTADGRSYKSESISTPEKVEIGDLYVERETNDLGEEGMSVFLDNQNSGGNASYFRYEYEETYKIIAPSWVALEFDIIDDIPCDPVFIGYEVGTKGREEENRICYNTRKSTAILQTATASLNENSISKFLIRFLDRNDFAISHRYSILVKQHSQSLETYSYYQNLEDFTSSDNIFSEVQPGFLKGNISSEIDENEKVVGYFEVTSVSERRMFFDYEDFFSGEALPPYPINCDNFSRPPLYTEGFHCDGTVCDGDCNSPLIDAIKAGAIVFFAENENPASPDEGPFLAKLAACGDCTKLGSNVKPDFWID